jgi:hypothetical protein
MSNFVPSTEDGCEIDKLSIPYSALNETHLCLPSWLHDRELVIDTLHVVVKPLNDNCVVLAWISQSTDIVIVRAETVALICNVIRVYFQQHFCKTLYSYCRRILGRGLGMSVEWPGIDNQAPRFAFSKTGEEEK